MSVAREARPGAAHGPAGPGRRAVRGGSRRRSREVALQVLYAAELSPGGLTPAEVETGFERIADHFELPAAARDFARTLARGVAEQRPALDLAVAACASHWRIERMALVDRNVLRLGAFELRHTATPTEVVIDEAVELARRFGGDRSPAFVNGVLDALAAGRRGEPPADAPGAP